jgi:hypothetical protein
MQESMRLSSTFTINEHPQLAIREFPDGFDLFIHRMLIDVRSVCTKNSKDRFTRQFRPSFSRAQAPAKFPCPNAELVESQKIIQM